MHVTRGGGDRPPQAHFPEYMPGFLKEARKTYEVWAEREVLRNQEA